MTVQNLWPLFFLILIPLIVLLYLLKQKAQDQPFSSTLLWQEIYKNIEAKTPFEKLKQNILMYMQILAMLFLIFALMAPVLNKGGFIKENVVLVVDTSASMEYRYDDKDTRLTHSIKEAKKQVDAMSEGANVTLVSCGSEAAVVYQGTDKATLKSRLSDLETGMEAGNLNLAAGIVNSLIADMENVQIICYTDTDFESSELKKNNKNAALIVKDVYSRGENCSLDYVNYSVDEEGTEALCKVTNYGEKDITQDISLYLNRQIVDVQTVTVKAGESETVYFTPQNIAADGSAILRAELSENDALNADNSQSIEVVSAVDKKILLLSNGNVFLEKALSLDESVTVYKSDDINVLNQTGEVYDLYVFDGIELPGDGEEGLSGRIGEHAGLLFLNYDKDFDGQSYMEKSGQVKNAVLSFEESPVTQYIEDYSFGITETYTYNLPDWARAVVRDSEGNVAGYYGVKERPVAVLGFDIHSTDLALQAEFPIFMSQLCDVLVGTGKEHAEITNFPVTEESDVEPVSGIAIEGTKGNKRTGGRAIRNLILLLTILLLIAEWIIYVRQVNSSKKKQFLAVRCLLMLAVILAMAGVSVTKKQRKNETIFLVDVSDSMSGNTKELEEYLAKTVGGMPEKNMCSVVAFGKDTAVDQFMTSQKIFSTFTVNPVTTATNIEKAVQTACSMFDEGVNKRLVLITDGSENEGSMGISATALKANDVEFYAISMEDSIGNSEEVYIDDLNVPDVIHVGDHYNVTVSVTSNVETDAVLSLYSGRNLKGQEDIHLTKGNNQFVFEDTGVEGTIAQYKAVIEPTNDTIAVNNSYATYAEIEAKPRVLLVEGEAGNGGEFEKILNAANIDYDKVTAKGTPTKVSEINNYKAVITLDVHYDDLREGFVKSLESYVKDFAGGYICIGGGNSYALGNYRGTVLEDILPVDMDLQGEKEIPKMSMTMVIDQSGSMCSPSTENSSLTGLDLAKQAALSGVSELRNTDEAGVLAFDDTYHWIVPLETASDIEKVKENIESIAYGGGTSIYPALQQAYAQVLKSDAKLKHIILLTDGQDGFRNYTDLINRINKAGITVSTVAVGEDADKETLSNIAEQCGGRYYYTDVNNAIPRIFAQEVYLSTNTYLINEEFYPEITSNNEILTGVFDEGIPALLGYIAATPKQTADVLLTSGRGDPVLSTWQCGLGRTVAWNSDGTNEWTAQYAAWEDYPLLWSNIINYVISDTELGDDNLEVVKEGNTASITYGTKEYDKNTKVNAVVTDENGVSKEISLDAVKPGVFETDLDLDEIGVYSVSVRKQSGDKIVKSCNTAYANQYSAEYQFTDSDMDLKTFVSQAGGTEITLEDNVWSEKTESVKAKVSLTVPLLILAILLFLFDIVIRRLSIDVWANVKRIFGQIAVPFKRKEGRKKIIRNREKKKGNAEQTADFAVENSETEKNNEEMDNEPQKQDSGRNLKRRKMQKQGNKSDVHKKEQEEKASVESATSTMNELLKRKRERE